MGRCCGYWGFHTGRNFAAWIAFAVLLVTGCIWLPIGGAGFGACSFCHDRYSNKLTPSDNTTTPDMFDKQCRNWAYSFQTWYPEKMLKDDVRPDWWWWCVNTGPLAAIVAGTVVLAAAFLTLTRFCCCARRPDQGYENMKAYVPKDHPPAAANTA